MGINAHVIKFTLVMKALLNILPLFKISVSAKWISTVLMNIEITYNPVAETEILNNS